MSRVTGKSSTRGPPAGTVYEPCYYDLPAAAEQADSAAATEESLPRGAALP